MVSQSHLEITREGDHFRLRDLDSTNGTWLDGERITEAEIAAGKTIRLGTLGPEFTLVIDQGAAADLDRTVEIPLAAVAGITPDSVSHPSRLASERT
jgi:pSer/pThr/pTyr-binding forkhead associated (FHA) protein